MIAGNASSSESELDRLLKARANRHLANRRFQREKAREKAVRKEFFNARFPHNDQHREDPFDDKEEQNLEITECFATDHLPSPVTSRESSINGSVILEDGSERSTSADSTDDRPYSSVSSSDSSGWRFRLKNLQSPSTSINNDKSRNSSLESKASSLETLDESSPEMHQTPNGIHSRASSAINSSVPLRPSERLAPDFFTALKTAQEDDMSSTHSTSSSISNTHSPILTTPDSIFSRFINESTTCIDSMSSTHTTPIIGVREHSSINGIVTSDRIKPLSLPVTTSVRPTEEYSLSDPDIGEYGMGWRSRLQKLMSRSVSESKLNPSGEVGESVAVP